MDCLWPGSSSDCINTTSTKTKVILSVVSTPNINILLRIGQVYAFIDDFTYYIYHNVYYG